MVDCCCMCRCSGEIVDPLLIHCGEAYQPWSFIFRSFGVSLALPELVIDLLFG